MILRKNNSDIEDSSLKSSGAVMASCLYVYVYPIVVTRQYVLYESEIICEDF